MTFQRSQNIKIQLSAKWNFYNDPNADDAELRPCVTKNFNSNPVCGGEDIQIWTWNFVKEERLNLYCYDQLEFYVDTEHGVCKQFFQS